MSNNRTTIAVKVSALTVDPFTNLPVVLLVDDLGCTCIPISIGLGEASAIAAELDQIELERPMTHQLVGAMLAKVGAEVVGVRLDQHNGSGFRATIQLLLVTGETVVQDARPSDALALALHTNAPISVAAPAWPLEEAAGWRDIATGLPLADEPADLLEGLGDEAFGKWKV